jgi:hypothetical protein
VSLTRTLRRRLLVALAPLALLAGIGAAPAMAVPAQTYVDTGWVNYDGGCQARTQAYYYTGSNKITMKTDVSDPYWFVACRVSAKPIFDTNLGPVSDGPTQFMMACAVFDPTCASTRYGVWETYDASATLALLKSFGLDLGSTISQVRIQHRSGYTTASAASASKAHKTSSRIAGATRATEAQIQAKEKEFAARR